MKALVITVGVGVGPNREEARRSIAHGVAFSIYANNPNKLLLIATEKSEEETLPLVYDILKDEFKFNIDEVRHEVRRIRDENDFNECFEVALKAIEDVVKDGFRVTVDFTSGTKAMSAGAVLAAVKESAILSYIAGKRVGGKVVSGQEEIKTFSPWRVVVDTQYRQLSTLFDNYQFNACLRIIDEVKRMIRDPSIVEEFERYRLICEGYYQWDMFNHEKAGEILLKCRGVPAKNKEFLGRLSSSIDRGRFLVADLLNNSRRRAAEGRYDDAVARLYRVVELLAQFKLRSSYGIDTSNVALDKLPKEVMDAMEYDFKVVRDAEGRIKLGLQRSYKLLHVLKDPIGREFQENRRLSNLLGSRNESILAHGVKPVTREEYDALYEEVEKLSMKVVQDLRDLMDKSKFPTFEAIRESI